jgi:hypothetical protein
VDKEQSGVATREYYLTQDIGWLHQKEEWAGLKSIGCVRRTLKQFNRVFCESSAGALAGGKQTALAS